jgi:hypothetical protein
VRAGGAALAVALALLGAAPAAGAEEIDRDRVLADLSDAFPAGAFAPTVGQWAVYRIGPEPYRFLRVAVLSKAATPHGEGVWLEVDVGPVPLGGALGMKLLTRGDPREGTNIERAYFRLAGGMVQELDGAALNRIRHPAAAPGPTQSMEPNIPPQDYTSRLTHAGSFRSVKVDNGAGTVFWLSPDAPVFHLVSIDLPDRSMEIFAAGDQAIDTMGDPASRMTIKHEAGATGLPVDGGAR